MADMSIAELTRYQLPIDQPSIKKDLEDTVSSLRDRKVFAVIHAFRKDRELDKKYMSLTDLDLRKFNDKVKGWKGAPGRKQVPIIDPRLGFYNYPENKLPESDLGNFFREERVFERRNEILELGGPNLFVSLDVKKGVAEKIDVVEHDLLEGLAVLAKTDRSTLDENEFLLYLGVLDLVKTHSMVMFNAITYPEREKKLPKTKEGLEKYEQAKSKSKNLAIMMTRMYYRGISGTEYDQDPKDLIEAAKEVLAYSKENIEPGEVYKFTFPEARNPISIILGASETALKNPEVDTVLGIQSGGVEPAIVLQMMYEIYHKKSVDLVIVPVSVHSTNYEAMTPEQVEELISSDKPKIENRNVVIAEDNSNTGTTLEIASTVLKNMGAKSDLAFIVDLDPDRILDKIGRKFARPTTVANIRHQNYNATLGKASTDMHGIIQHKIEKWYENK